MNIPMLDLVAQYNGIKEEIDSAIQKVLSSGAYINGSQVKEFEDNIADFLGVKHAIGVASGSDALLLSLDAIGIKSGDKVIVPTFTFFATAGAVSRLGATPVFVDIDPKTYNLNLDQVRDILKKDNHIKAIIPVHLFGLPVDMQHLMALANDYRLKVIEDACQAINADVHLASSISIENQDKPKLKAGTIGETGCFSFFPSKNLGCFGDGGMIVTNDDELAEKIHILRVHGSRPKYHHQLIGYNSRLDTLQAAVLSVKLKYLNEWTEKRRNVAKIYAAAFDTAGLQEFIKWPQVVNGHVFHQYVIQIKNRDKLAAYLKTKGINTAVYYPEPLHLQPCYKHLGYQEGELPIAENASKTVLALPVDPELTEKKIKYIVKTIEQFLDD